MVGRCFIMEPGSVYVVKSSGDSTSTFKYGSKFHFLLVLLRLARGVFDWKSELFECKSGSM